MKRRYTVLLLIPTLLLAGVFIYSIQRSNSIYLNHWLAGIGDGGLFTFLQSIDLSLPRWMVYSLPDGLWMLSFILTVLLIWDFRIHRKSLPWLGIAIIAGLMFEILQGFHVIKGTFDFVDLVVISIAACVPLSYILLKRWVCRAV